VRLTGSVKAAENYVKSFEKEWKSRCTASTRRRLVSKNTIRMYNQLVRNGLVFLIVGVLSLFPELMSHP